MSRGVCEVASPALTERREGSEEGERPAQHDRDHGRDPGDEAEHHEDGEQAGQRGGASGAGLAQRSQDHRGSVAHRGCGVALARCEARRVTAPAPAPTGYLSAPVPTRDRPGPWPGVVVVHDVTGVSDDVREQADWLAAAGYLALVPDLLTSGGGTTRGVARVRCVVGAVRQLRSGSGPAFAQLEGAREQLAAHEDCTGVVGVIGYCMGGGFALLLAPRPGWSAASANYGQLPPDLAVLEGACPVVGSYGGADRALRGAAARLEQALEGAGVPHDVKEYPGAQHGFINRATALSPLTPLMRVAGVSHDHEAAADAKRRILAFFDEHLRPR